MGVIELSFHIIFIIISFGFLAAFIDAVVGGGGLISIPALLAIGMPPSLALGTNKLASAFGSLTSAIKFLKSGNVDKKIVFRLFPFVFIFAVGGASLATFLPSDVLKPLVIVILTLVLIYTIFKKEWGNVRTFSKFTISKAIAFISLLLLIGFMLFVLLMFGFDFLSAAGNAKVLNFASNVGALTLFIILGQVNIAYGLIMAVSMVIGSYTGAHFAIKKGVGYVKILFIIVTILLILKNTFDYIMQIISN